MSLNQIYQCPDCKADLPLNNLRIVSGAFVDNCPKCGREIIISPARCIFCDSPAYNFRWEEKPGDLFQKELFVFCHQHDSKAKVIKGNPIKILCPGYDRAITAKCEKCDKPATNIEEGYVGLWVRHPNHFYCDLHYKTHKGKTCKNCSALIKDNELACRHCGNSDNATKRLIVSAVMLTIVFVYFGYNFFASNVSWRDEVHFPLLFFGFIIGILAYMLRGIAEFEKGRNIRKDLSKRSKNIITEPVENELNKDHPTNAYLDSCSA